MADKRYSTLKNQYEMTLNANAVVVPAGEDSSIAKHHFSFIPLSSLEQLSADKDAQPVGVLNDNRRVSLICEQMLWVWC